MQKHPNSILVQYLLCQRDHAFHLTRQQERFEFATAHFFFLFGIEFYPHLCSWGRQKKRLKRSTPFASRFMFLYGHRRGGNPPPPSISLYSLVVSLAQVVTTVGRSMFLFPHLVLSSLFVLRESSGSRRFWLKSSF